MTVAAGLFLLAAGGCSMARTKMIEEGVYETPLLLSKPLEPKRAELQDGLLNAQRRLRDFAVSHGWGGLVKERFMKRAEIFDDQEKFKKALFELTDTPMSEAAKLPKTICASLEEGVFMSVSPEVYDGLFPGEKPQERAFERLIAHEMAHRLHVRILKGDEDAMGPIWFFEGFAIHAVGQYPDASLTPEDIWKVVEEKERGSYKRYAAAMDYFLMKVTLEQMVRRAKDADFVSWLRRSMGVKG